MARSINEAPDPNDELHAIERNLYRIVRTSTSPRMHEEILRKSGVKQERSAYPLLSSIDMLQPIGITDLATVLGVTQSTASRQLGALTDAGLVARTDDPDDRRAAIVRLTPKGERVLAAVRNARDEMLGTLLEKWSTKDRRQLNRYLARLADEFAELHSALENRRRDS